MTETQPTIEELQEQLAEQTRLAEEGAEARERLTEIENANRSTRKAEGVLDDLKDQCKEAKVEVERCHAKTSAMIDARNNDANRPLFNREPDDDPEPWRGVALTELFEMPSRAVELLGEGNVFTIGDVLDLRADGTETGELVGLTIYDGIGPKVAETINKVVNDFVANERERLRNEADPWRTATLDDLQFPAKLQTACLNHGEDGLRTLGAIEDFRAEHELTDLEGIGPAAEAEAEELLLAYYAALAKAEEDDA